VSMIEKRTTRSGPRYEVRLRGPDGKERSRTFRPRTRPTSPLNWAFIESGRRESNPHYQLGRLELCH